MGTSLRWPFFTNSSLQHFQSPLNTAIVVSLNAAQSIAMHGAKQLNGAKSQLHSHYLNGSLPSIAHTPPLRRTVARIRSPLERAREKDRRDQRTGHVLQDVRGVRFRRLPVPVVTHTSGSMKSLWTFAGSMILMGVGERSNCGRLIDCFIQVGLTITALSYS